MKKHPQKSQNVDTLEKSLTLSFAYSRLEPPIFVTTVLRGFKAYFVRINFLRDFNKISKSNSFHCPHYRSETTFIIEITEKLSKQKEGKALNTQLKVLYFLLDLPPSFLFFLLSFFLSFCTATETINTVKRWLTKWEKIFANQIPNKGVNIQNI